MARDESESEQAKSSEAAGITAWATEAASQWESMQTSRSRTSAQLDGKDSGTDTTTAQVLQSCKLEVTDNSAATTSAPTPDISKVISKTGEVLDFAARLMKSDILRAPELMDNIIKLPDGDKRCQAAVRDLMKVIDNVAGETNDAERVMNDLLKRQGSRYRVNVETDRGGNSTVQVLMLKAGVSDVTEQQLIAARTGPLDKTLFAGRATIADDRNNDDLVLNPRSRSGGTRIPRR